MSRHPHRPYKPSETHLALHPPSTLITCPCGVKFAARAEPMTGVTGEDDPDLCLTCNRARWSRLWNGNRPVDHAGEVVSMADRRRR